MSISDSRLAYYASTLEAVVARHRLTEAEARQLRSRCNTIAHGLDHVFRDAHGDLGSELVARAISALPRVRGVPRGEVLARAIELVPAELIAKPIVAARRLYLVHSTVEVSR